jgi:hypothetical protein
VAPAGQLLDDAHGRVRDAVNIGRERLSDISDSHAQTLRDAPARPSVITMTGQPTVDDIS